VAGQRRGRRIEFLTVADVLAIQRDQLARYGGASGLRDAGALESAVAQPMAIFGGEYLHGDLFLMAAAYLFHLCENHPFVDGNKRAAYASALVFLRLNGVAVPGDERLYALTMNVAKGALGKGAIAELLTDLAGGTKQAS
jgi:death-on-curing protein